MATKFDEKIKEDHSVKFSPVPFSLPLIDVPSTPPRTNAISSLSATKEENNTSSKSPGIDGKEGSEMTNDLNKEETPRVSHSIEGDLYSHDATEMDLKLAAVFDGE